jgi:hypothetical protein
MNKKELIIKLAEMKLISNKPKPMYVFMLFFAYLLIWIVTFIIYLKYDMQILKFWIIVLGILAFGTLIFAFFHKYAVEMLGKRKI